MTRYAATPLAHIAFTPRIRKSPFFDATRRWGCNAYTVYNHMFMPLYYADPETDFWNLVRHVTLWDVAAERQVQITGPDAARFTQLLTPRNLSSFSPGQAKYVLITNDRGAVINDPILLKLAQDRFWISLSDSDVLLWAQGVALGAGMDVDISEPDVSPLQVQGPRSTDLMTDIFGDWIGGLRYYWFREIDLDGIPLLVSRTGWSSERGYEIFLRDRSRGDELWELIMDRGARYRIAPSAPSSIRRIEGGMLSYGSDTRGEENPFELGLGRLVDVAQDADFIGKAALTAAARRPPSNRLCGLEIGGEPVPGNEEWWRVTSGGEPVGTVRSAVHSPRLGKNIALAVLDAACTRPGSTVAVTTPWGERPATVVEVPFHDPKKTLATG